MVEIPSDAGCKSLPKQRKCAKKVEIYKSLPKQQKSVEKVENPDAAFGKSLPKRRKTGEKGRKSHSCRPEISTQTAKISRKG